MQLKRLPRSSMSYERFIPDTELERAGWTAPALGRRPVWDVVLFAIALILFGVGRLPRGLGRGIREFRKPLRRCEQKVNPAAVGLARCEVVRHNNAGDKPCYWSLLLMLGSYR